ncbi:DUF6232 family protein [Methylophilus sp. 5]|uniref:DUF6232 family protein n=1 Tax=Methylophilus sp. 5 TaxID=1112274 RepID=UPI00048DB19D|nr:DUF6232 family protein [Methylophilus sp. 5]
MDRKVFFSDGGIIISDSRFIASGYIYNIRDIISARQAVIKPPRALALFSISIGLLFLLNEGRLFVVGGCAIALGVMTWIFTRTTYAVMLKTATGEHAVLRDRNSGYVAQVIQALDAALVNRGDASLESVMRESAKAPGSVLNTEFAHMAPTLIE